LLGDDNACLNHRNQIVFRVFNRMHDNIPSRVSGRTMIEQVSVSYRANYFHISDRHLTDFVNVPHR